MRDRPNPNWLGTGVTEEQVQDAVCRSGYPLQIEVAKALREAAHFGVQEEWSFLDGTTSERRNLDLRADLGMFDPAQQSRVRPTLTLLIECKKSELPYVFFVSESGHLPLNFPLVAGLHSPEIAITTDDESSRHILTIARALELHECRFLSRPPISRTFSKCVRKGKVLELSGADPYNNLILPLASSLRHFLQAKVPLPTFWYHDVHLVLAVAVLDAPILTAEQEGDRPALKPTPWIRVLRHEYRDHPRPFMRNETWVVDVVQRDAFSHWLKDEVVPFARCFASRALAHATELADGKAFVAGMGSNWRSGIEKRMRPTWRSSAEKRLENFIRGRAKKR